MNIQDDVKSVTCKSTGDPHITTFDGKYVSQFVVDVETMLLELFFVDTEIFVICCLHVMHSKHNNRRRNSMLSPRAKDKKNLRDSIWLQSNSCISENWR